MSNDALPSSSTPAKQKGPADSPVIVSVEVHEVPDSEQDEDSLSEDPLAALAHIALGTQTSRELTRQVDSFQPSSREEMENQGAKSNPRPS